MDNTDNNVFQDEEVVEFSKDEDNVDKKMKKRNNKKIKTIHLNECLKIVC